MKITNHGISNASLKAKESIQGITPEGRDGATDAIMQNMDLYIPSHEWLRIQNLLHKQPEIRSDRVALAGERLTAGYYHTSESAHQTAAAIVSSLD